MKAIQVKEPGKLSIIEKDMPKIKSQNEVIIKVKAAGICGSDMHIYHGTSPVATYPRVIGHEFVGEVAEIGNDVKNVEVGDRVVVEPILYCGKCYACKAGRPNVCEGLEVMGVHTDGGFQEYIAVPEDKAHKFNKELDWKEAVLIEPFTIAAQATSRGDVREGDYVFIIGAGPIGLSVLQYAKYRGATCIVSDIDNEKLETAKKHGADYIVNSIEDDVAKKVYEITNGMGANVTIDAACLIQTFEQAVNVTSAAGRIVVMGFIDKPSSIPQLPITKKEITISGSRLQSNKFPEVVKLFNENKLNPSALVSHVFNFTEINKAIELIENPEEKTSKVILEFSDIK